VAPQQAIDAPPTTVTTAPAPTVTGVPGTRPTRDEDALPDFSTPGGGGDDGPGPGSIALAGHAHVGGLWLVGVPSIGALRRARRRHRSHGHPELEVIDAWSRSLDALALLDVRPRAAETSREFARRASSDAGVDPATHEELADLVTAATYGQPPRPDDVARARRAATAIAERCRRLAGPWRRIKAAISPGRQLRA
jgi:hypothetical protein